MKNIDVMEKLEKYCQMSITISREYSPGWIFGAIDFACYAGLIDLGQRGQLLKWIPLAATGWDPETKKYYTPLL